MNATTIPLTEAKDKLSELVDRVSRGEQITITRHGQEVAKLTSVRKASQEEALRRIQQFRKIREKNCLNPPGMERITIKDLVNEGRNR